MNSPETQPRTLKTRVKESVAHFTDRVIKEPFSNFKEVVAAPMERRETIHGVEMVVTYLNQTANKDNQDDQGGIVDNRVPEIVILHETATPPGTTADGLNRRHLSRNIGTSWNYIIDRDGTIHWYVDESKYSAWHAGVSRIFSGSRLNWGSSQIRRKSIGIEMVGPNDGHTPATEAQKEALAKVLGVIEQKYNLKLVNGENVFEHTDVAVYPADFPVVALRGKRGRKSDATGYDTQEILDRMPDEHPKTPFRLGDWFVNVAIARVRTDRKAGNTPVAKRLLFGSRVDVDNWGEGQIIDGDPWWAHMRIGWGFLSKELLSETQPSIRGVLRRLEVKTQSAVFARVAPFLESRAVKKAEKLNESVPIRRLPLVDCGGRGDAMEMWDPVLYPITA